MLGDASTNPHAIVVLTVSNGCLLATSPSPCQSQSMNSVETSPFQSKTNRRKLPSDVTGSTLTLVDNLPLIPAVVGAPHDLSLIPSKHIVFDIEPFFAAQKFWGRLQHRSDRIPAAATPDLRKTSASLWQTPNVTFAHVGTTLQAAEQIAVELYPN